MAVFTIDYERRDEELAKIQITEPKYMAKKVDTALGRVYVLLVDNEPVLDAFSYSATTLLSVIDKGIGFLKFYAQGYEQAQSYGMYRAWIGTLVHDIIEKLLQGLEMDLSSRIKIPNEYKNIHIGIGENIPPEVDRRVEAFVDWWNTLNEPEILAVELLLFDPKYYVAGTLDLLIRVDGKVMLVDFKTGKKHEKTQSIQLTYYKNLVEILYDIKVDEMACLFLTDKGKYKYEIMNYEPEIAEITYHLFKYKNSTFKTQKMPDIKINKEKTRIFKL